MDQRKLSDTRDMGDVGLDSEGFPSDYDPKTVRGVPGGESSEEDNYPAESDVNYEGQDEVREWEKQGEFRLPEVYTDENGNVRTTREEVMNIFSDFMDAPTEDLEAKGEPVTDGGVPYGEDDYEGTDTLEDVDHEVPFDGAPW